MADDYDLPKGDLMAGKKGLVMGLADQRSVAFGISAQLKAQGAELAISFIELNERRARPLAEGLGALPIVADVQDDASMDALFDTLESKFGTIDFLVHSLAFADRNQLKGSFVDNTTREGFRLAMDISVFSFVDAERPG